MAKPIGPICNLDCSYCFYLEKEALYPGESDFRMPDNVLEQYVRQYIEAQPRGAREVGFAWQGGEPTLMGVDFFRRVIELQQRFARPGMTVTNALQTNGTRLDDDWGAFLKEHSFLIGLSVDGPEAIHNQHRYNKGGKGSFDEVMRGLEILKKHEVEFNTLTVLHHDNATDGGAMYDFLKGIGSQFMQFIPIVEHEQILAAKKDYQRPILPVFDERGQKIGARSVRPDQFGAFLNGVFDRWLECEDVGEVYVQHFDLILGMVLGHPSSLCVHGETCGRAAAIEHNGDVYSCDHYVSPEYQLGNVTKVSLPVMMDSDQQKEFGRDKRDTLPKYCKKCDWLRLCWGACPKDRILNTPDGEPGLAYLCEGYMAFYKHTVPVFEKMAICLNNGRPARDYKQVRPRRRMD
jgi:uncharacterized protein